MTFQDYKNSLHQERPPDGLDPLLLALWYAGQGDWEKAHDLAQEINTTNGAWIHAMLHRQEGDSANAAYWYQQGKQKFPTVSIQEEWDSIARYFLSMSVH